jgi:hypothetical protein
MTHREVSQALELDQNRVTIGCDLVTRRIGGETIIVPVTSHVADLDSIYTLNSVASGIWHHLENGLGPTEIVNRLCSEYEIGSDQATRDLHEFFAELAIEGLVRFCRSEE